MNTTKSNATYTPGPWVNDLFNVYRDGERGIIAKEYSTSRSVAERTSNARLIAAAPELLGALEAVDEQFNALSQRDWLDQVRAAIRKAKGE